MNCNYKNCVHGGYVSYAGHCLNGDCRNANCPKFEDIHSDDDDKKCDWSADEFDRVRDNRSK